MLNKFCIKAFQAINLAVGATSLVAIAVGVITVFGGAGLFCLEKTGVKTIPDKQIQQTLFLGVGSTFLGSAGFLSASFAAVCVAWLLDTVDWDDEEEISAYDNTNSLVFKESHSVLIEDNNDLLYLYKIMQIEGCYQLENKLIVGRIEEEISRKIVVYDLLDSHHKESLMKIFDVDFDEDRLIGKAFSSLKSKPWDAICEFIDFCRPQLIFKDYEEFSNSNLETCAGCRNFHGADKIVCGMHPYGWDDSCACPDWESDNQRVYFQFEREEVIKNLNQRIEINQATLEKYDDGILILWDTHTSRRFRFSWAGILLDDSDKLVELGEHARLLSYVQYFSVRVVIEFDYSSKIDEFAKQLRGIATIKISDTGINVSVNYCPEFNIKVERQYCFQFNGIPLDPYQYFVPKELKYNYNLVTLVEWLKVNKARLKR